MSSDELEYYRTRAAQEREAAADAAQADVAAIHLELARLYEALLERPELRSFQQLAWERRNSHSGRPLY